MEAREYKVEVKYQCSPWGKGITYFDGVTVQTTSKKKAKELAREEVLNRYMDCKVISTKIIE